MVHVQIVSRKRSGTAYESQEAHREWRFHPCVKSMLSGFESEQLN